MSKARKLQSEIDLTLRKIWDGVEEWDVLFEKFEEVEVGRGLGWGWGMGWSGGAARHNCGCNARPLAGAFGRSGRRQTLQFGCSMLLPSLMQDGGQRERIALELKKELKKLQRLREQVGGPPL